jgi:hypothetical protein
MLGKGCRYKLGRGGFDPWAAYPWPAGYDARCDCSGFVAWVLGMRRDQINARKPWSKLLPWIETSLVWKDATGKQLVFVRLLRPEPGCLVVVPDRGVHQGHIAIVTDVRHTHDYDVVDCSARGDREGINERPATWFLNQANAAFVALREDLAGI